MQPGKSSLQLGQDTLLQEFCDLSAMRPSQWCDDTETVACLPLQPCFAFAGEQFENDADFKLAKSMILDLFRGRLVDDINLKVCCPLKDDCTQWTDGSSFLQCLSQP